MTETEWLAETYPDLLLHAPQAKVGLRKLRLFAVACCRRVAHLLPADGPWQESIGCAERFADHLVTRSQLLQAHAEAGVAFGAVMGNSGTCATTALIAAAEAVVWATLSTNRPFANDAAVLAAGAVSYAALPAEALPVTASSLHRKRWIAANEQERAAQILLLRDIIGDPFHPVRLAPEWRTVDVRRMAEAAYFERDFAPARLGVLADALEEAGCAEAAILDHLRAPGPHVRGCFIIDLLLGKK